MTTPDPCTSSSLLEVLIVTTESAAVAATAAYRLAGTLLSSVCRCTFELFTGGLSSTVFLPRTPPIKPTAKALRVRRPSAVHDTLRPENTSRTPTLPTGAADATGRALGTAGVPIDGAADASLQASARASEASRSPSRPEGASTWGGRCSVSPGPRRPNASATSG